MRIFRQKYRNRDGTLKDSSKWYVEFRDHRQIAQRIPGYIDKGATRELGRKLERLTSFRAAGDVPDSELLRWLESVPQDLRDRLVKIDLLSGRSNATGKTLVEHLAEFRANLEHKGRTTAYVELVVGRVSAVLEGCRFRFPSDISASMVEEFLSTLKAKGKAEQTRNFYTQAAKQFCRWMVKDRRATENPLSHLTMGNVATDRRLERRELTEDEIRELLSATWSGPTRFGLTGEQRLMLYAVALGTGLRASELASLSPKSFNLDADPPTVRIEAAQEKARRGDTIPLSPDLVSILRPWLASVRTPLLWPGKWAEHKQAGKFMQRDLVAARDAWLKTAKTPQEQAEREKSDFLSYRDADGMQADFHALRHTFLSRLGRAGVPAKVMQRLARHSTVELTLGRYTHASVYDLAAGVGALPPLPIGPKSIKAERQTLRATGTDDATPNVLPLRLPETAAKPSNRMHRSAVQATGDDEAEPSNAGLSTHAQVVKLHRDSAQITEVNALCDAPNQQFGEVAEWPIAPVLKTGDGATHPRVRIPASPP